ncbi:hypothetical protein AN639_04830 [Candidatus Epulonipiscium fishelsonii]|uniref:Uncharacterized protein n=1 Tax=Candidatus Epulonipiscium fishelsonii TaxID=77094 RepID=A0ACC8XDC8_9FIRM|nr:hypothetical protein AN639_04830 [Epulopiscium sp. SCG-B05WGA-EpuloA1]ONI40804.1 hypothetical protein AN396_05135 [Epulopiscium sp. SCG-B11WGA-EpuloA1]
MKLFSKLVVSVLTCNFIFVPTFGAPLQNSVSTKAAQYADFLINNRGVRSVQYALMKDGKFIVSGSRGINSIENDLLVNTENMYAIGSISKMFTTAMIMNLLEEGKFELDDPVYKYIPDFAMEDDRYKDITIRMLLNHSAGFMDGNIQDSFLVENNDSRYHDNLLKNLKTERLNSAPGELSVYSNTGFMLSEILIERVSGLPYTEYLYKYISQPLSLDNTKTPEDNFNMAQVVRSNVPYLPIQEFYEGDQIIDFPIEIPTCIGTAGIFSTAEDLCKFSEIFLDEGILEQNSIDLTTSPEYLRGIWPDNGKNMIEYGLGWDAIALEPFNKAGITALFKGGDISLTHSALIVIPEYDMSVVVLSTGGSSTLDMFMGAQMLIDELVKEGKMQPPTFTAVPSLIAPVKIPSNYSKYNGIYSNLMQAIKIDIKGDRIELSMPDNPNFATQTFLYQDNGIFKDEKTGTLILQFVDEDNGHTYINFKSKMRGLEPFKFEILSNLYQYQQIPPNPVSNEVKTAWQKRLGKMYYPVTLHYNVITNTQGLPSIGLPDSISPDGYIFNLKVKDENTLENIIQIPVVGRSSADMEFYDENGTEYLKSNQIIYVEEKGINDLLDGTYVIDQDGYAKYFKASNNDTNVQININGNGSYTIYNPDQICIYSSVLDPDGTVKLTPGSLILISGEPGTTFDITKNVTDVSYKN